MRTSIEGMLAIIAHEAIVLETYKDSGGVLTIGIGHTAAAGGMQPRRGDKITVTEALRLFVQDLRKFETRVSRHIKGPLKPHEFDGFVSFDFNTGKIDDGTVDDKWNAGKRTAAIATLKAYSKDNGKVVKGLVRRRAEEAAMITEGRYPLVKKLRIDTTFGKSVMWPVAVIREQLERVVMQIDADTVPQADVPPPVPTAPPKTDKPSGAVAGGVIAVGTAGGAGLAAGYPWQQVLLVTGCAAALAIIIYFVVQLRKEP